MSAVAKLPHWILTADNSDTADKIDTFGFAVTNARVDGDNVVVYVGENNDRLILQNATGKDFQIDGITAQVAKDNLIYDGRANYYQATGKNATLTVDAEVDNANIWLGNDNFVGNIKVLDASKVEDSATLSGGANSEKIFASKGNSSLWGGTGGNDTLIGGSGDDEFFYSFGNGNDIIDSATENDVVNIFNTDLNQIRKVEATASQIKFQFTDNSNLIINSAENIGFKYQDKIYQLDRQNNSWSQK